MADIKEKIKISEDDIKTLFFILDDEKEGFITIKNIEKLKRYEEVNERMK